MVILMLYVNKLPSGMNLLWFDGYHQTILIKFKREVLSRLSNFYSLMTLRYIIIFYNITMRDFTIKV